MPVILTNKNVVNVTERKDFVNLTEKLIDVVSVKEYGAPIYINQIVDGIWQQSGGNWYADAPIYTNGLGQFDNFNFKPIFTFTENTQIFDLFGYATINGNGLDDPFTIKINNDDIFKVTTDELPVFKVHDTMKDPISGALLFYQGNLFFAV